MTLRIALALLICAAAAARAEPAHDSLTIGIAQFPSSLHPNVDPEVVKSYALGFVLRPITAFDADWKNSCLLCAELPTIENGLARIEDRPDGSKGMAVTIKLKPGLQWGDGKPVTARDIAFTWKLGADPASGFSNMNPWNRADAVEVVDPQTAVMHLPRVRADYNQWDQILPEHVEGITAQLDTSRSGTYINNTRYNHDPVNPGLYDGPYMITAYDSGSQIVLEPNPHWGGVKPGFARIVLRHIENTAALQANLLSGDVDMVAGEGVGLTIDQVLALQKAHPDQFKYEFKPSLTYEHIDLKRENPLLADVRVRRALLMSIDRETMVNRLFQGKQPVAATFVNPLNPNYDAAIPIPKFDPAGARALLAEAGWTPGAGDICQNAAGERLSFELGTTAGNRLRELQEQVLQSNWRAACVEITLKNEPARTLFGETLKHRSYGAMEMYGWSSGVTESPFRTLATSQIPTAANGYGGANYPGFSNPAMDADIAAVEGELDPVKRKAIWADMQRIYADAVPVLPLFFRADPHVTPVWLRGYVPTGDGRYVQPVGRKLAPGVMRARLAAAWLAAAVLGAGPAVAEGAHRTLTIGVSSFPSTLSPVADPDVIKFYILGFADRPVTTFDADYHLMCLFCTELPSLANGDAKLEGAGMAVTFHFKPGLTWADGAPFGAADLAFTARVGHDPNSGFTNTKTWERVSRVDVVDPLTAVVHLTEPNYQFDQLSELLPAHLDQAVYEAAHDPGSYLEHTRYVTDPTNPGLYNGPYRVTEDEPGSLIVLERNEHWAGARPYFDRIVIKTIANTAALAANLLSGDVDMVPGEGIGMTLDQVLALQKQHPDSLTYAYRPNFNYTHVDLQLDNPILADVRVRRALLMGLDRQSMVDRLMGGRVPIANSFANPLEPFYTPDVTTYRYDPAGARALLAEAGWHPGDDGVCRNAAGDRLSLEFITSAGVRARELLQQVMQSEWRAIGVETTIHNEPGRTLFGETLKHRRFTGMALFSWSGSVESSQRQILSSGQVPTAANNWGGGDYTDFRNAAMDADIDNMERELTLAARKPIWADMQRIYADQLPVLPLFFGADAHVWPKWLKGVTPTGQSVPSTLWSEFWRVDG